MRFLAVGLVALPLLVACAGSSPGDGESSAQDLSGASTLLDGQQLGYQELSTIAPIGDGSTAARVLFMSDGGAPAVQGQIVSGGTVTVVYALGRLSQCRASHDGFEIWDTRIGGEASNGTKIGEELPAIGSNVPGTLKGFDGSPTGKAHSVAYTFTVPAGADTFFLYAHNTSPPGPSAQCDAYDSNNGQNYQFRVDPRQTNPSIDSLADIGDGKTTAAIVFDNGFDPVVKGNIVQGGKVIVAYALDRLGECRPTHDGWPFWTTQIGAIFDDGTKFGDAAGGASIYDSRTLAGHVVAFAPVPGQSSATAIPVTTVINVPAGATELQLYAHNWNPGGPVDACSTFDSKNGQNYRFKVTPR